MLLAEMLILTICYLLFLLNKGHCSQWNCITKLNFVILHHNVNFFATYCKLNNQRGY